MNLAHQIDLHCSLCKTHFDTTIHLPRMLPECGHTFCSQCIVQSLEKHSFMSCSDDQIVSNKKEIAGFPKNFALIQIVEKKRSENQAVSPIPQHKDNSHSGSLKKDSLNNNFNHTHNNISTAAFNLTNSDGGEKTHCSKHNKQRDIVCFQCKEQICANCALFGPHKKHEVLSLDDTKLKIKKQALKLEQITEEVDKKLTFLKSEMIIEVAQNTFKQSFLFIQKNIGERFEQIISEIRKIQMQIERDISDTQKQQLQKIRELSCLPLLQSEQWKQYTTKAKEQLKALTDKCMNKEISFSFLQEDLNIILEGEKTSQAVDSTKNDILQNITLLLSNCSEHSWNKEISSLLLKFATASNEEYSKIKELNEHDSLKREKLMILIKEKEEQSAKQFSNQNEYAFCYQEAQTQIEVFYSKNSNEKIASTDTHFPVYIDKPIDNKKASQSLPNSCLTSQIHDNTINISSQLLTNQGQNKQEDSLENNTSYQIHSKQDYFGKNSSYLVNEFHTPQKDSHSNQQSTQQSINDDHIINSYHQANGSNFENLPEYMKESLLLSQSMPMNSIIGEDFSLLNKKEEGSFTKSPVKEKENFCQHNKKEEVTSGTKSPVKDNLVIFEAKRVESEEDEYNEDENLISEIAHKDVVLSQLFSLNKVSFDDINLLEESTRFQDDNLGLNSLISPKNQQLHPQFFSVIQEILKNSIESADFSFMEIMDQGLEAVAYAIQDNTSLKRINFDRNKITNQGFNKLIEALESSAMNLEVINLNNNLINENALNYFFSIQRNKIRKLTHVHLTNNLINPQISSSLIKRIKEEMNITVYI